MSHFTAEYKDIMGGKMNGTRRICHPKDIMKVDKIKLGHTSDLVVYFKLLIQ
jgi:hypothetical protein